VRSKLAPLKALLSLRAERAREIRSLVENERCRKRANGDRFATAMEHVPGPGELQIQVESDVGSNATWHVMPYHGTVRVLPSGWPPEEYVVPDSLGPAIELIHRHGVHARQVTEHLIDSLWTEELEV
jgi:hypothetical protein